MRYNRTLCLLSAVCCMAALQAQNPYDNENYMPTDLIGTARYVGMGGALGALGADISAISANPAAIGLYRRGDASLAFSVLTQADKPSALNADMTHLSFDQLGFVFCVPVGGQNVKFVNMGFTYQRKANFNHAFLADNPNTRGLSQTTQMADILSFSPYSTPLADLMYNAYLLDPIDGQGNIVNNVENAQGFVGYLADQNNFDRVTEGGIYGYEFNISTNVQDRYYLGFTLGVNDVDYYSYRTYGEFAEGGSKWNYTLRDAHSVSGYGINAKFGAIVRPLEFSPLRIGLTVETPTFYHLDSYRSYSIDSRYYHVADDTNNSFIIEEDELGRTYSPEYDLAKLQLKITTPWKARVSIGHTIDRYLAIGAEYEYANYGKTKQGYEETSYDYWGDAYHDNYHKDGAMSTTHKRTLRGVHSFKFGFELNVTSQLALRAGYNYYSSMFKKSATMDQTSDTPAWNYQTTTDYMNKGDVNIFTVGLGFHGKHFYADAAYKYRMQSGDFYAFDDTYIKSVTSGRELQPVNVKLDTHQVAFSIGYKF